MAGAAAGTVLTPAVLREWPLPPNRGDKDARGRVVVVGGNVGNPGAVMLSAEGALRAGAGKVQLVAPEPVAIPVAVTLVETLVVAGPVTPAGNLDPSAADLAADRLAAADAVLVGPGLLDPAEAAALVTAVAPHVQGVLVLDALALAWVTEDPARVQEFAGRAVLSPNARELALTLGDDEDAVLADLPKAAKRLAKATGAVVTSGHDTTAIATPDGQLWHSEGGNPGLGVSGSGDVKAGIVAGLCSRGAEPAQAAVWASYLHGAVGGRLAARYGPTGFLARELPAEIPAVFLEVGQ